MTDIKALIAHLSNEALSPTRVRSHRYWAARLIGVLTIYAVSAQIILGIRPDLTLQLSRPYFTAEILLLAALLLSSGIASVLSMYPDAYQKPKWLLFPYIIFFALIILIIFQLFIPLDNRMMMPKPGAHALECAICIAIVALIPSALIFTLLRKGASVRPLQAGAYAILTASAIGCLTLRLAEAIDSIPHLIIWHYIPTLLFATLGAYLGKWLLKW